MGGKNNIIRCKALEVKIKLETLYFLRLVSRLKVSNANVTFLSHGAKRRPERLVGPAQRGNMEKWKESGPREKHPRTRI